MNGIDGKIGKTTTNNNAETTAIELRERARLASYRACEQGSEGLVNLNGSKNTDFCQELEMMNPNVGNKRKLSNDCKRAAHVKFDGMTIALGTFPDKDADNVCHCAQLLTKTWRDMYPKPSVEWVKRSLERSGIRLVNDRSGRQPGKGGQIKKERSLNTKLLSVTTAVEGEGDGISVIRQIQANSLLYSLPIPTQSAAKTTMTSHTDSITNTTEGGRFASKGEIRPNLLSSIVVNSPNSTSRKALTEAESNLQDLKGKNNVQCGDKDKVNDSLIKTSCAETDNEVKDQQQNVQSSSEGKGSTLLEDLKDLDIEGTYTMFERHHANLINEIEETSTLIDAYREERDRRRQAQKQIPKVNIR